MITIYKNKKDIPEGVRLVEWNDLFFNKHIMERIDEKADIIIKQIDHAKLLDSFQLLSGLNGELLNIDHLSSGCKTALNMFYFPENVFSLKECGNNALDVIYKLKTGQVFCEYPVISFEMRNVYVCENMKKKQITDYEELKEWWQDV